jgi:hypothetical protein
MYREGPSAKANFNRQNGVVLGDQVLSKYKNAYSQASSSVGTNFTRRVPQQYTPASTENSLRSMRQAGAMFDKQIDLITTAASKSREAMLNVWNGDCKKIIADGKAAQIGAQNANSKQALCSGITVGRSCNIGAGNFSPKNPCSGKVLRCNGRGKYEAI